MSTIPRKRIRMKADAAKRTTDKMTDVFTGSTPELWRGNDCQFEFGLFLNSALITDVSNIASLTLEILDAATRKTVLLTKTLTGAELTALTDATWTDGTAQHALFACTAAETNFTLGTALTLNCWLVLSMTTNDAPGRSTTIQASQILIVEDGTGTAGTPPDNTDNYYTKGVADARFVPIHADQAWMQWRNGCWYGYAQTTDKWYRIQGIKIVDGQPALDFGVGETL